MRKILLVEDNPSDEKLTLLAFQRAGVANEIDVVRDGREALDYLGIAGAPINERPRPRSSCSICSYRESTASRSSRRCAKTRGRGTCPS